MRFEFGIQPTLVGQCVVLQKIRHNAYHLQNVLCCVSRERLSAVSIMCIYLRKEKIDLECRMQGVDNHVPNDVRHVVTSPPN